MSHPVQRDPRIDDVLTFWFGVDGTPGFGQQRDVWWRQDDAFDAAVVETLGPLSDLAQTGALDPWGATPEGAVALVLLLDQVPRNRYRDSALAYACDALALAAAERAIAAGHNRALTIKVFEQFLYLPFQHSEDLAVQDRSVTLFAALGIDAAHTSALEHRAIIERFGRFPHRNAVMGRPSTAEETAYLADPTRPMFAGGRDADD